MLDTVTCRTTQWTHRTVVGARSMNGRRSTYSRGGASFAALVATLPSKLPPPPAKGVLPPVLQLGVTGALPPAASTSSSAGMLAISRLLADAGR